MTPISIQPVYRIQGQPDWIFWVFLAIFLLLAWIQVNYSNRLYTLFRALFSTRHLQTIIREGNIFNERIFLAISLMYVLTLAMVVVATLQLVFDMTTFSVSLFRLYLLMALVITGFWAVKILIMNFLGVIFKTGSTNTLYQVNLLVSITVLAILLLPVMLFAVYLKSVWLVWVAFSLILFISLVRFVKGFVIGLSLTRFSYFFLFVYLCTLEIVPVLIAAKVILTYF